MCDADEYCYGITAPVQDFPDQPGYCVLAYDAEVIGETRAPIAYTDENGEQKFMVAESSIPDERTYGIAHCFVKQFDQTGE